MERMTVDETNLRGILEQCGRDYCKKINGDCSKCSFLDISLEKLRNYEKAEENGMLIHLPCPIGTIVHKPFKFCGEGAWDIAHHRLRLEDLSEIGKTVFVDENDAKAYIAEREREAEQALKQMGE